MERIAGTMVVLGGGNNVSEREGVGLCNEVLPRAGSSAWQDLLNLGCQRQAP